MPIRKSWLSLLAAGVVGVAASVTAPYAEAASPSVHWGTFQVPNLGAEPVEIDWENGQPYVDVWHLERLFAAAGWGTRWDGRVLTVTSYPQSAAGQAITLNQRPLVGSSAFDVGGVTYVNLSKVAAAQGGSLSFDASTKALVLHEALNSLHSGQAQPRAVARAGTTKSPALAKSFTSAKPVSIAATISLGKKALGPVGLVVQGGQSFLALTELGSRLQGMGVQLTIHGESIRVSGMPVAHAGVGLQAPTLAATGDQSKASKPDTVTAISVGSDWYVPALALGGIGFQVHVSGATVALTLAQPTPQSTAAGGNGAGTVASTVKDIQVSGQLVDNGGSAVAGTVVFEDQSGQLHSVSAGSDGRFSATIAAQYPASGAVSTTDLVLVGAETAATGWVTEYATLTAVGGAVQNVTVDGGANQAFSSVQGRISYAGSAATTMPVTEVSLRNVITQAHYYAPVDSQGNFTATLPVGPYEVFALITAKSAIYSLQPFVVSPSPTPLTVNVAAPPAGSQVLTAHAVVKAGDAGVLPEDLLTVANIFEHVYPLDTSSLGLAEKGPITLTLYSSLQNYEQHFAAEGYSDTEAKQIAEDSGAVTEGPTSISVPMQSFGEVDGLNVLAHELTHALIATESLQLPSWANEGLAWHQGILGQLDGSPVSLLLQGAEWTQWFDIVQNQRDNSLMPLGTGGPLDGSYNVEDQDYYAVEDLLGQYGLGNILKYVSEYDHDATAFQEVFGTSFASFSQKVTQDLTAQAAKTDSGFSITFKVLAGGPSDLYVQNTGGTRVLISGLEAGQVYTITCKNNGAVILPSTLTSAKAKSLHALVEGDWYIGTGVAADGTLEQAPSAVAGQTASSIELGSGYRQEFEIANQFQVPFLVRAIMYDQKNDLLHAYPSVALPSGLELVSLSPLA